MNNKKRTFALMVLFFSTLIFSSCGGGCDCGDNVVINKEDPIQDCDSGPLFQPLVVPFAYDPDPENEDDSDYVVAIDMRDFNTGTNKRFYTLPALVGFFLSNPNFSPSHDGKHLTANMLRFDAFGGPLLATQIIHADIDKSKYCNLSQGLYFGQPDGTSETIEDIFRNANYAWSISPEFFGKFYGADPGSTVLEEQIIHLDFFPAYCPRENGPVVFMRLYDHANFAGDGGLSGDGGIEPL